MPPTLPDLILPLNSVNARDIPLHPPLDQAVRLSIFGSCVSRDSFIIAEAQEFDVQTYIGRQSFVGLTDPPLEAQEDWFPDKSAWKRRSALFDLNKKGLARIFADRSDYLIVDFIDERFDLLNVGGTHVSDIKEVRSPRFVEHYGDKARHQARLSDETLADWTRGLAAFAGQVRAHFRPDRVILHKARWARRMLAPDGRTEEFSEAVKADIVRFNALMDEYFALFMQALPEAHVVEVDPNHVFADPDHQWSKEPFHYTNDYYVEIVSQLRALIDADRKAG